MMLLWVIVLQTCFLSGASSISCSGRKFQDDVYCNIYKECMADETIEDNCCPFRQKFDIVSLSCVNIGEDHCTVDSSCYQKAQVSGATCVKDKRPFLIADSTYCDLYKDCRWIYPNATFKCCPHYLVFNQATESCDCQTADQSGCIRKCVTDVPSDCDFAEMRLCMPLADSPKDYSRSRFAVINHGVTFKTVNGFEAAYFDDNHDQLQIDRFGNLWNGNTPTDIQISLKFLLHKRRFVQNNWVSGNRAYIMSNEDCIKGSSLAMYIEADSLGKRFYRFSVQLADKSLTGLVVLTHGNWIPIRFRFYGSTGTLELKIAGYVNTVNHPNVNFTYMKTPLIIGNSVCKLGTQANMYIRDLKFSEKHF